MVVTADDDNDYDVDAGHILLLIRMLDNGWYWICDYNVFKLFWLFKLLLMFKLLLLFKLFWLFKLLVFTFPWLLLLVTRLTLALLY